MVKDTIAMTVFDREPEVLINTLRWLAACDLTDTEVLIVDDCSHLTYDWVEAYKQRMELRWVTLDPYECFKIGDTGYKNPSKAFNRCLSEARSERVTIISSDVIVPPRVWDAARKVAGKGAVYCPMTIDLATSMEYCGPHRIFPMPWLLSFDLQDARDAGGWDENYLLGLCWEDNDFVGRLALRAGKIVCDWTSIVWHQSHDQPAYDMDNYWIAAANKRNRAYTMEKWKGLPFGPPDLPAFAMSKTRHESGHLMLTFEDVKGVYDLARSRTLSPFVGRLVT